MQSRAVRTLQRSERSLPPSRPALPLLHVQLQLTRQTCIRARVSGVGRGFPFVALARQAAQLPSTWLTTFVRPVPPRAAHDDPFHANGTAT